MRLARDDQAAIKELTKRNACGKPASAQNVRKLRS